MSNTRPIIIFRALPDHTAFTCLTCGQTMTTCSCCGRILCRCTNTRWYGDYMGGHQCYRCENKTWPTPSGMPWDQNHQSIDVDAVMTQINGIGHALRRSVADTVLRRIVGCSNTDCAFYNVEIFDHSYCKGKCPKCGADLQAPSQPKPPQTCQEVRNKMVERIRTLWNTSDWTAEDWRKHQRSIRSWFFPFLAFWIGAGVMYGPRSIPLIVFFTLLWIGTELETWWNVRKQEAEG